MDIEIAKMTSKGQIVIPQDIRDHVGLREGERFLVFEADDSIILKRINHLEKAKNLKEFEAVFSSMWKTAKKHGVTRSDATKEIEAHRRGHV